MNRHIIAVATLCAALSMQAQGKLDLGSRARLRSMNAPSEFTLEAGTPGISVRTMEADSNAADSTLSAFITLTSSDKAEELSQLGVTVKRVRASIALAEFPQSLLAKIEQAPFVKKIELSRAVSQKMDLARKSTGIDRIHAGENLPQPYTGKGVLTGIVDGGFDPNHINFLDADGKSRFKQFSYFYVNQGGNLSEVRAKGDAIDEIDTENSDSFHATHTTGIMAGGYRGQLSAARKKNSFQNVVETVANPYYGVAYESDIAASSAENGQLSDQVIAYGIESILDYAYGTNPEERRPVAINLSLGSNVGPHDGSSAICRYLDAIIEDDQVNAIVCISAGNEGDLPIALTKTMAADGDTLATGLFSMYNGMIPNVQNPRMGLVYIYSDSKEPFDVQAIIMNKKRGAAALRMPLPASPDGASHYWCSSMDYVQDSSTDEVSAQFARYLEGYCGLNAETDADSGRYYSVIDFFSMDNTEGNNSTGDYVLCFQVTGKAGQRIHVYGDGQFCSFTSYGINGFREGSCDGTINDIATGKNTIIVGSYSTRDDWASMDGTTYGYQGRFLDGRMSPFTSFGTLVDGRKLPDICAPGAAIISSANEYYLDAEVMNGANADAETQARLTQGGRVHSWFQCTGTSMAAPVVTGTMALWLEAYPQLTAEEAKQVLRMTAVRDNYTETTGDPIQWGAGKLDAYNGLKQVLALRNAGVDNVAVDADNRLLISAVGQNVYELSLPGAQSLSVKAYDTAGRCVAAVNADSDTATLDMSGLTAGVYIINVNNSVSQKLAIR